MENLTLDDRPTGPPPQQQPNVLGLAPPTAPQLPPQMFTTAAQLLNLTDKKLLIILRDGRKFTGVLRSWDQFANLVLQDTTERMFVQEFYADVRHGVYIVRGENVLLLGEIDLDQEDHVPEPFKEAPVEKVRELMRLEAEKKKKRDSRKAKLLHGRGFEGDMVGESIA